MSTVHLAEAPTAVERATPRPRIIPGIFVGLAIYLLQNLSVWAGALAAHPLWHLRNYDSFQYLGYLTAARTHWLLPNLHMAWDAEPAMYHPLYVGAAKLGWWLGASPEFVFHVLSAVTLAGAGIALVWLLDVFAETKAQRVAIIIAALSAMPVTMFGLALARFLAPSTDALFWVGTVELAYSTADGLLRGGLSNSPSMTVGAGTMLLALALVGARLKTGRRGYSWALAVTCFASATLHPFEIFVIVPATVIAILWLEREAWRELIPVVLAAGLGLAPHILVMLNHPWLADASQSFDTETEFSRLILRYGIGFLAVPYMFLMRAWPRTKTDKLLVVWWLTTVVITRIPGAPFPPHLLDGFSVVTGLVIVRLAATEPKLRAAFRSHPKPCYAALAFLLATLAAGYGSLFVQMLRDGGSTSPGWLLSTVATDDEAALVRELQTRAKEDDLVLAPDEISMMLVRVPMHAFASHQHVSLDYAREHDEAEAFYKGNQADLPSRYGIAWVVVPDDSPALRSSILKFTAPEFTAGHLRVFHYPENHMAPYPGLAAIQPDKVQKLGLFWHVAQWYQSHIIAR